MRLFDVETSHKIGILAAKLGFFPKETRPDPACLRTTVWGREFPNPLGEKGRVEMLVLYGEPSVSLDPRSALPLAMYMMA